MNTIPEEDNLSLNNIKPETEFEQVSLKHYLMSILIMPFSLRIVCVTNLFSWMAHVCYSLYFTDFVGEAVFLGNPAVSELYNIKKKFFVFLLFSILNIPNQSLFFFFYPVYALQSIFVFLLAKRP